KLKEQLDLMVSTGGYRDFGDAIASAVENWHVIHKQLQQNAGMVVLDGTSAAGRERGPQPKKRAHPERVPDLFLPIDHAPADAPQPGQHARNDEDEFSPDQWVFGQFNKLLPLKANCRA